MLIEVGWKKGSRSLSSVCASPQLSKSCELARTPFASITDMINTLQTKAQSEASQTHQCIKETVP